MGRKFPASFLRILTDYFCLLEFEWQDLRRNTATMGCTVHFLPISLLYSFLFIYFLTVVVFLNSTVYFVCDSASEFGAKGSTSFLGFSYPNLLLVFF